MPYNIGGMSRAIERVSRENPELFGKQTTEPLDDRSLPSGQVNPWRQMSPSEQQDAWRKMNLDTFNDRFGPQPERTPFEEAAGIGGISDLTRAREGMQYDGKGGLNKLEGFALNEQIDARKPRRQEGVLARMARRAGASEDAAKARSRAGKQAAQASEQYERMTRGRSTSARQQVLAKRRLGLNRALAEADAGSRSRRTTTDKAIAARNAFVEAENTAFGQQFGGLSALANADGQRIVRQAQERAQKKSNKRGLLGTIVGGALSFIPGVGPIVGPIVGGAIANG